MSLRLFDILFFVLPAAVLAVFTAPFTLTAVPGALGLMIYPIYAWFYAPVVVARLAGFRPPVLAQKQYLDYLGTIQEVWTHPSPLMIAGRVASSKRSIILLTSGALRELSEADVAALIEKLATGRRTASVVDWTYHMATAGRPLFWFQSDLDSKDVRRTMMILTIGAWIAFGAVLVLGALLYALALAAAVFWVLSRKLVLGMARKTGERCNGPISLGEATFWPMKDAVGPHPRLSVLGPGLVFAADKQNKRGSRETVL